MSAGDLENAAWSHIHVLLATSDNFCKEHSHVTSGHGRKNEARVGLALEPERLLGMPKPVAFNRFYAYFKAAQY
jgi:hypothetical protein